jgi:hypothetical protein
MSQGRLVYTGCLFIQVACLYGLQEARQTGYLSAQRGFFSAILQPFRPDVRAEFHEFL